MPFNAGGQTYEGGRYLFAGISGIGKGVADAVTEMRQAQQDEAADGLIIKHALDTNQISPEDYTKFVNGSRTQKNGIVAGLARNFAMDLAKQHSDWNQRAQAANVNADIERAKLYRTQADEAGPFKPSSEAIPVRDESGNIIGHQVQTSKNAYGFRSSEATSDTWENLNKDVKAATGVDLGDWQNAANKRAEGGSIVADITKPDVFGQQVQKTIRVPVTSYDQFMQRFNRLQGGPPMDMIAKSTPTPAPSATPVPQSGLDKILGMIKGSRPLPAATPAVTPGPATAPAATAPTRVIEKNGHHYEVDDANKKVVRQID